MKDTLKIIDGWDQITVGQYEELIEIQKEHPDESAKYIVEYLYDVEDADKLPLPEYVAMVSVQQRHHLPVLTGKDSSLLVSQAFREFHQHVSSGIVHQREK